MSSGAGGEPKRASLVSYIASDDSSSDEEEVTDSWKKEGERKAQYTVGNVELSEASAADSKAKSVAAIAADADNRSDDGNVELSEASAADSKAKSVAAIAADADNLSDDGKMESNEASAADSKAKSDAAIADDADNLSDDGMMESNEASAADSKAKSDAAIADDADNLSDDGKMESSEASAADSKAKSVAAIADNLSDDGVMESSEASAADSKAKSVAAIADDADNLSDDGKMESSEASAADSKAKSVAAIADDADNLSDDGKMESSEADDKKALSESLKSALKQMAQSDADESTDHSREVDDKMDLSSNASIDSNGKDLSGDDDDSLFNTARDTSLTPLDEDLLDKAIKEADIELESESIALAKEEEKEGATAPKSMQAAPIAKVKEGEMETHAKVVEGALAQTAAVGPRQDDPPTKPTKAKQIGRVVPCVRGKPSGLTNSRVLLTRLNVDDFASLVNPEASASSESPASSSGAAGLPQGAVRVASHADEPLQQKNGDAGTELDPVVVEVQQTALCSLAALNKCRRQLCTAETRQESKAKIWKARTDELHELERVQRAMGSTSATDSARPPLKARLRSHLARKRITQYEEDLAPMQTYMTTLRAAQEEHRSNLADAKSISDCLSTTDPADAVEAIQTVMRDEDAAIAVKQEEIEGLQQSIDKMMQKISEERAVLLPSEDAPLSADATSDISEQIVRLRSIVAEAHATLSSAENEVARLRADLDRLSVVVREKHGETEAGKAQKFAPPLLKPSKRVDGAKNGGSKAAAKGAAKQSIGAATVASAAEPKKVVGLPVDKCAPEFLPREDGVAFWPLYPPYHSNTNARRQAVMHKARLEQAAEGTANTNYRYGPPTDITAATLVLFSFCNTFAIDDKRLFSGDPEVTGDTTWTYHIYDKLALLCRFVKFIRSAGSKLNPFFFPDWSLIREFIKSLSTDPILKRYRALNKNNNMLFRLFVDADLFVFFSKAGGKQRVDDRTLHRAFKSGGAAALHELFVRGDNYKWIGTREKKMLRQMALGGEWKSVFDELVAEYSDVELDITARLQKSIERRPAVKRGADDSTAESAEKKPRLAGQDKVGYALSKVLPSASQHIQLVVDQVAPVDTTASSATAAVTEVRRESSDISDKNQEDDGYVGLALGLEPLAQTRKRLADGIPAYLRDTCRCVTAAQPPPKSDATFTTFWSANDYSVDLCVGPSTLHIKRQLQIRFRRLLNRTPKIKVEMVERVTGSITTDNCPNHWKSDDVLARSQIYNGGFDAIALVCQRPGHACQTALWTVALLIPNGVEESIARSLLIDVGGCFKQSLQRALPGYLCDSSGQRCVCQTDPDDPTAGVGLAYRLGCRTRQRSEGLVCTSLHRPQQRVPLLDTAESSTADILAKWMPIVHHLEHVMQILTPVAWLNMIGLNSEAADCRLDKNSPFSWTTAAVDASQHFGVGRNEMEGGITVTAFLADPVVLEDGNNSMVFGNWRADPKFTASQQRRSVLWWDAGASGILIAPQRMVSLGRIGPNQRDAQCPSIVAVSCGQAPGLLKPQHGKKGNVPRT